MNLGKEYLKQFFDKKKWFIFMQVKDYLICDKTFNIISKFNDHYDHD